MRHLPTAGGGPALTAVLGNHAALLAAHPAVGGPQAKAGTLRPLGAMGTKRVATFPDVPTLKEMGYDAQYYQWNGLFTQAKVPEPIITFWRQAVAKAVKDPEFIKAMQKVGSGIDYLDRDEFRPWWDEDSQQDRGNRARHRQGAVAPWRQRKSASPSSAPAASGRCARGSRPAIRRCASSRCRTPTPPRPASSPRPSARNSIPATTTR